MSISFTMGETAFDFVTACYHGRRKDRGISTHHLLHVQTFRRGCGHHKRKDTGDHLRKLRGDKTFDSDIICTPRFKVLCKEKGLKKGPTENREQNRQHDLCEQKSL